MVAFGDPSRAEVATLGINPSAKEFIEGDELLAGSKRRLATLSSLCAERLDQLTNAQVAEVVADCASYFERQPYHKWFDPLDDLLRSAVGVSYYERTACHLDLIQWATNPVWGQIRDPDIRKVLLADGVRHLHAQLEQEQFNLILLNGRQVLNQVQSLRLANLDEVDCLPLGSGSCRLYTGTGDGIRWVGWSANLQSSWGVSSDFKHELGEWLKGVIAKSGTAAPRATSLKVTGIVADGYLQQGLRVYGKTELVEVLRQWLMESDAQTVGDVGSFGRRPWLVIEVSGEEMVLNADTKRSAAMAFVKENAGKPERPWSVIANRAGRFNKVIPGPDRNPIPGWYAYLSKPRSEEGVV